MVWIFILFVKIVISFRPYMGNIIFILALQDRKNSVQIPINSIIEPCNMFANKTS